MSQEIQLLPDAIANQIAAGEVVQRPASVVKELVENAIDAGATDIILRVKEGGKTFIQVVDNGKGMSEPDARMCFERHATSKIRSFDDMQRLRSYGFRGEALASIAAVSQLELRTRQASQDVGTLIRMEGSEIKEQEPVATEPGTSFTVRNLFFNVPARRNFLKSNQVEFSHVAEELNRVALSYPEVGFQFFNSEQLVLKSGSGNLARRIAALFGDSYRNNLLPVSEETDFLKVHGYIGKPELARKTRGEQYFFANQRFIKNAYLHHAVASAFEGLLPQAHFPFYVLFLEIGPEKIDINVHPTKTEIKFENERFVYAVVQAAVRKALQHSVIGAGLDFEPVSPWLQTGLRQDPVAPTTPEMPNMPERRTISSNWNPGPSTSGYRQGTGGGKVDSNWEKLFGHNRSQPELLRSFEQAPASRDLPHSAPHPSRLNPASAAETGPEKSRALNLHGQYLLYQVKSGLMWLHLARAWERICYERLLQQLEQGNAVSQQLLFPLSLEFSESDRALLEEMGDEIRALGIDWSPFGGNTVVVRGLPSDLPLQDPARLFQDLLEQYRWNQSQLKIPRSQALVRALAKKSSLQQDFHHWKDPELLDLIHKLFACHVPDLSPDGQPISRLLRLEEVKEWF